MLQAISNRENFCKSNTMVLVNAKCVYVKLYDTIIYILRNGIEYFSDGGFNTVTTSSRLRALGANYSTNENKNGFRFCVRQRRKINASTNQIKPSKNKIQSTGCVIRNGTKKLMNTAAGLVSKLTRNTKIKSL